ncbi:MAG TPA: HAMP domain-containing histidine kinase [Nitrospirae bacterium]|nr:HAMP domain-containing histidine kinase [Nitrospirota bacterium]
MNEGKTSRRLARFKDIVSRLKVEVDETGFWRLQVAARDAILSVDASSTGSQDIALEQICEIVRLLFGGTTSSIILENTHGWRVAAATGEGAEKIVGLRLDLDDSSISSKVIKNKTSYYFSQINDEKGVSRGNAPERYPNSAFCSFPLLGMDNNTLGVVNVAGMDKAHPIFTDERVSMEGALETIAVKVAKLKKNEELMSAQKDIETMKEAETIKEKLLYMTIHDLKNPLTLINANLAHLENAEMDEMSKEIVLLSKFGGERILDMVKTILDSYKIEAGKMTLNKTRFNLVANAKKIAKEFNIALLSDSISVQIEGAEEVFVEADEIIIHRIFANLMDNAIRFSPLGGKIIIQVGQDGASVSFSVKDEGAGIDPASQEEIFDAFERARSSLDSGAKGNYGLGLSFCKMAVKEHGGKIKVDSEPGAGSKFTVTLPREQAGAN